MHPPPSSRWPVAGSFPRTRGDAPTSPRRTRGSPPLPPHTRGCTGAWNRVGVVPSASPAHAGMHPGPSHSTQPPGRFPRTRGDAPAIVEWIRTSGGLPPHTRGCTGVADRAGARAVASPAHAGMHPGRSFRGRACGGFPRTRGDAPVLTTGAQTLIELPPHTRGCTAVQAGAAHQHLASPAHAGMHRGAGRCGAPAPGFPRTRGDAPWWYAAYSLFVPASPAHAGMHRRTPARHTGTPGFPRTRGDAPSIPCLIPILETLPPHTRGCTRERDDAGPGRHASPAHAGMHPEVPSLKVTVRGFPRTRGDAPFSSDCSSGRNTLPPHTRGCTATVEQVLWQGTASPAHAGMHRHGGAGALAGHRFPRTRGDAPMWGHSVWPQVQLPPHTRGCTEYGGRAAEERAASPAHAGMHPSGGVGEGCRGGFPRTRGDAPVMCSYRVLMRGLPPHTRGCTFRRRP